MGEMLKVDLVVATVLCNLNLLYVALRNSLWPSAFL